jgi:hypothetical protein
MPIRLYMIECSTHYGKTFFSKGISMLHVPFEKYETIKIFRLFYINTKCYRVNLLPAFLEFQKFLRRRIQFMKSPRYFLSRQNQSHIRLPQFQWNHHLQLGTLAPSPFE